MLKPRHVLIVGGGVAALEAALALKAHAEERVDVELLAPEADFVYKPLAVAEPFGKGELRTFPLKRLVELAGARLTAGAVARLDLDGKCAYTADGVEHPWEILVLAVGAGTREGVAGGLTFRGAQDRAELAGVVDAAAAGRLESLTFALPSQAAWPLPLYELALMTKTTLDDRCATQVVVSVVTPEPAPLAVFGAAASREAVELLEGRRISLYTHTTPVVFRNGALVVVPGRALRTDQVVCVPVPEGRRIPGLPQDGRGFVQADEHGRVEGRDDVFAVGDMTAFPIKQGGIAAQQADAAAEWIASLAGAPIDPQPFRPVLRGLLLTGLSPRYLRAGVLDADSEVDFEPLWWPPGKIAGRHLGPFLARHVGVSSQAPPDLAAAR